MRKAFSLPYLLVIILMTIVIANNVSLKAQNLEEDCLSEPIQFTHLFHFGLGYVTSFDVNSEGTMLAVAGEAGVWLYNVEGLTPLRRLEITSSDVQVIAWSPDSTKIAAYMGPQNGIAIYDVQKQETLLVLKTDDNFQAHAYTLSWSPDGNKLAVIGTLAWRVWDTTSGQVLVDLTNLVMWPESINLFDDGLSNLLVWSPDNMELALPDGKNIAIFDVATWKRKKILVTDITRITSLDWSSAGQLAVVGQIGPIQVWDVQSERLLYQVPIESDHFVGQWSNDGETLAVGGGSEIYLVDAQDQAVTKTLSGHLSTVYDLVWDAREQFLISRGGEGSIYIWDTRTAQPIANLSSG